MTDQPFPLPANAIFVVGYPRSGTTLVQSLLTALATDPVVVSFPETHFFNVIEKSFSPDKDGRVSTTDLRAHVDLIREKTGLDVSEKEIDDLCGRADGGHLDSHVVFEWIIFLNLLRTTEASLRRLPFRWLEKTPYHANFLERILTLYPRAQVVHVVRHPVVSVISRQRNFPFNRDTSLEELARHWDHMLANVERASAAFPGRIFHIHYESLVTHPQQVVGQLETFLGITMDIDRMHRLGAAAASVSLPGEPWKKNAGQSQLFDANNAYLDRIPGEEAERIEAVAGERMADWGYSPFRKKKQPSERMK